MPDEDPSSEDLERFGGETAFCPACGAQMWDQAEICPRCGAWTAGPGHRTPLEAGRRRRVIVVVSLLAAAALLLALLRWL